MNLRAIARLVLLAALLGAAAGCSRIHEPWDQTGYFKQERERTPALDNELRQRAREQSDRTLG